MNALHTVLQTLLMQARVDVRGAHLFESMRARPGGGELARGFAPAVVAGPMPGGERGGLVEEEQLGPAAPAHDLAPHAAELADADDPGLVSPAAREKGAGRGIVDDAAVSHERAALFDGDDFTEGRDAVLQRHADSLSGLCVWLARGACLRAKGGGDELFGGKDFAVGACALDARGSSRTADAAWAVLDRRLWTRRDRSGRIHRQWRIPAGSGHLRETRAVAAVGDAGGCVLPDRVQHRADALHRGHRRTRGHGIHAYATGPHLLGLVLRGPVLPADRLAGLGGHRRGRDLLPVPGTAGRAARRLHG